MRNICGVHPGKMTGRTRYRILGHGTEVASSLTIDI